MQHSSKQILIDHIKNNSLSDSDKEILIELLNKNDLDNFLKYFFSISKISFDLLRFFDIDIGDFHLK